MTSDLSSFTLGEIALALGLPSSANKTKRGRAWMSVDEMIVTAHGFEARVTIARKVTSGHNMRRTLVCPCGAQTARLYCCPTTGFFCTECNAPALVAHRKKLKK